MNGKKLAVSFIAILLLVSSAFGSVIYAPKTVQAAGPKINLKALLVTRIADYYSSPYNQQAAENIMRDWGIPFDVTTINSVTALTFWDSVNQVNRYQYVVYFGDVALSTQGNDPTTAVIAIKAAINNGTDFLFVGPSVKAYASLFGLSSLADCPANPQNGGTCGGVLKFGIKHPFSGVLRGDTSWPYGKVLDGTGYSLPDYAMMTSIWNGTGTLFLNATANGVFYPNTIYEKSGPKAASIWWYSNVEGPIGFYRGGWQSVFSTGEFSQNQGQVFAPEYEMFYYALQNITKYDVRILPWSYGGSAEVIRAEDHMSLCPTYSYCDNQTTDSVVGGLLGRNLTAEIDTNIVGWSDGMQYALSTTKPAGVLNPQGIAGYRYWTTLSSDYSSRNVEVYAVVDNQSSTSASSLSTTISAGKNLNQTINFADGNTTEITNIRVDVNTSAGPNWVLKLYDKNGVLRYTSPSQTTTVSSATWINLFANATGAVSNYVSSLQGKINIGIAVSSGSVTWWNSSSSSEDYVVTGRSNWDVGVVQQTGVDNFASYASIVPDSIRMANGAIYPQQNATVYIGRPGLLHISNIVGETNKGSPTSIDMEYFFNSTVWASYGSTQVSDWDTLVSRYGWQIETNGWTHSKVASAGNDNDFYWGNGTLMSSSGIVKRVGLIKGSTSNVIGSNYVTLNLAFGTSAYSYYPAESQLAAAGYWFAQLATQNVATLSYAALGYFRTSATGGGSIWDMNQGNKLSSGACQSYSATLNQTRDMLGAISTHSDSTNPWCDYDWAKSQGWTQRYDLSSTWFCGTTSRCFNFWNATLQMLTNVNSFQWDPSTGNITWVANMGTASQINSSNLQRADPLVIRLPQVFQGLALFSAHDNESSGSIANSTASWAYYQINTAKGKTNLQIRYGSPSTTISLSPSSTSASTSTISSSLSSTINNTTTTTITSTIPMSSSLTATNTSTIVIQTSSTTTIFSTTTILTTNTTTTTITTTHANDTTLSSTNSTTIITTVTTSSMLTLTSLSSSSYTASSNTTSSTSIIMTITVTNTYYVTTTVTTASPSNTVIVVSNTTSTLTQTAYT